MLHTKARSIVSFMVALIIMAAAMFNVSPAFAAGNGTAEYTVKAGENLTGIAKKYGLTVEKLLTANPEIKDPNLLLVGQKIILPTGRSEGLSAAKQGRYYRWQLEKDGGRVTSDEHFYLVKNGDTLESIAKAYGVKLEKLIEANPQIEDTNKLYREELVRIPEGRAENVPPFYFTPSSNDSK